ncbi:MAG: MerR family transcriptional regulator [Mycobacterium sp.]|nr:MerR family transcriptional regulator [Mycobacterium sp.]
MSDDHDVHMQIGQVATRTELSVRTVRHYDDVGLVTPSVRSPGGFRLYTDADVARLLVIRRMKPLGFTLAETKELLAALDSLDDTNISAAKKKAALQRLREYRAKTDESAERLRTQLTYAEELAQLLAERAEAKVAAGRG